MKHRKLKVFGAFLGSFNVAVLRGLTRAKFWRAFNLKLYLKLYHKILALLLSVLTILPPTATLALASGPGKPEPTLEEQYRKLQDFSWGVLAINPDKAVYQTGDTANFSIGVLDEKGDMVCDAELDLQIVTPKSEILHLKSSDGNVQVNPECIIKNKTNRPDYEAHLTVTQEGAYGLTLTAKTKNGIRQIRDGFFVSNSLPLQITRQSATRVFPLAEYEMKIRIQADRDFSGNFTEPVPANFTIIGQPKNLLDDRRKALYQAADVMDAFSISSPRIEISESGQNINFPLNLKKGEATILEYSYKAPNISPEFYILGPGTVSGQSGREKFAYTEPRAWQIANDQTQVKAGNFTATTTAGSQVITGLGFQPKAIIFYWTYQKTDNAFLNTGAGTAISGQTSIGMGIASQTGSATSSFSVAECDDSTGSSGTTSDSKQRISSTSTIMLLNGGLSTATCNTGVDARAVVTSMDSDGFTLNWSTATTAAPIIRYFAVGGQDIINATTGSFTLTSASSGLNSISNLGFKPDFVFYLGGDTATYDSNIADANMTFGFSTYSTSTQQAMQNFAVNDSAATAATRNTQTTASSSAALSSAVTATDYAFRTWSMDSGGFTINVGNVPAADTAVFYLALKGGQYFVGATTSPTATGIKSTTGLGFKPQGMFVTSNGLAASTAIQNNAQTSIGAVGWATTTGVSATTSLGMIGFADANGDANPSNSYDTRSNSLVRGYQPYSTNNTNPFLNFEAVPISFDSSGFTWNFTTATTTARQILYWAIGSSPTTTITGNVYSDEGVTGLVNARTIKLLINGTSTMSTTTVAGSGAYTFQNVPLSPQGGDIFTVYLSGAAEKAVTVAKASTTLASSYASLNLYQNQVIVHDYNPSNGMTNANLGAYDGDDDADIPFTSNSNNLTTNSGVGVYVWQSTNYVPGGTVTTQGSGNLKLASSSTTTLATTGNTIGGDIVVSSSSVININGNTTVNGGDITTIGTGLVNATTSSPTVTISGTGSIGGGAATTSFYALTTSGSGTTNITSPMLVTGALSAGSGTTLAGAVNIVASSTVSGDGAINLTGGAFEVQGNVNFGGNTAWTFYNLNIGNGATATVTSVGSGSITVTATATIGSTSSLNAGTKQWIFSASGTPLTINSGGSFTPSTSTVSFKAVSGTTTVPAINYYNLDISPSSGSGIFVLATTTQAASTVTLDATASTTCSSGGTLGVCGGSNTTLTYSLTVGSNSNRALGVFVTVAGSSGAQQPQISSVTYAGVSLSQKAHANGNGGNFYTDLWTLPDGTQPTTGTNNVVITLASALNVSSEASMESGAFSVYNVSQSQTWTTVASSTGNSTTASLTLGSSGSSDLVVAEVCNGTGIISTSQTLQYQTPAASFNACASSEGDTAAGNTTNLSWSVNSDYWIATAGAFKAYSGTSPATTTVNNNFTVSGPATADAYANNTGLTVAGNMTVGSSATFKAANSAGTNITGNLTNSGTFNASSTNSILSITGDLTTSGTFIAPSATTTISGSLTNSGTFTHNSGTLALNSSASTKTINTGNSSLYNLSLTGTGTYTSQSTTSVDNVLTVGSSATFNGGTSNIILSKNGSGQYIASATTSPTVVQHVTTSNSLNEAITNSGGIFRLRLPEPTQAENLLVAAFQYSGTPHTFTVADDLGNSFTLGTSTYDSTNGQGASIYYLPNTTAGARIIKITHSDANLLTYISAVGTEFSNIATSSSADGSSGNNGSSATTTAGSFTPSVSGDMVYQFSARDTTLGNAGTFTAGTAAQNPNTSWQLLSADLNDGTAAQWTLYNSTSAINPTLGMTNSGGFNSVAMAFKTSSSAGSPASSGIRVRAVHHISQPSTSTTMSGATKVSNPSVIQVPVLGNLLVAMFSSGNSSFSITGITDNVGNIWTQVPGGANSNGSQDTTDVWYAKNFTATSTLKLSVTYNSIASNDASILFYDISGADTDSPYDTRSVATGNMSAASSTLYTNSITPTNSNGIILMETQQEFNTENGFYYPSGAYFDAIEFDGMNVNGPQNMDQNGGWGHYYNTGTSTQTITWNLASTTDPALQWSAYAAAFKAASTSSPLMVNGTFTASTSTVSFKGTSGVISVSALNYYNLDFSPASGSPTFTFGAGTITATSNLTLSGTSTLDVNTNDPVLTVSGNVTIGSGSTFLASNSATTTITGNLTINGAFTHNSGTVVFGTTTATSVITSATSTSFNNFAVTTPGKTIQFKAQSGNIPVFTFAGTFTVTGSSGNLVTIESDTSGTQWLAHFNSNQAISYAYIKDSGCDTGTSNVTVTNGSNGGNNGSCWLGLTAATVSYGSGGGPVESGSGGGTQVDVSYPIARVSGQNTGNKVSGASSPATLDLAFPGNLTAGNDIIVASAMYDNGVTPGPSYNVSTSSGTAVISSFTEDKAVTVHGGSIILAINRAHVISSGSLTIRVTGSGSNSIYISYGITEYANMATSPVNGTPDSNSGTGATESTNAVSSSAGGLVVQLSAELSSGNFTYSQSDANIYKVSTGSSDLTMQAQDKLTPSAGSNTLTAGTGNSWSWWSIAVAYKGGNTSQGGSGGGTGSTNDGGGSQQSGGGSGGGGGGSGAGGGAP